MDRPSATIVHPSSAESPETRRRRHSQASIDQRLSRRNYVAAKTLEHFGAT